MKPFVTVITTTYYRPDFLERCILAVKNQTLQNYEHFIFSDHCPYAGLIYEQYKTDPRITFVENDKPHIVNDGAVGKRRGIEDAKSDIICYCDDDNILLPNHLETIYNNIGQHECIFTKFYHVQQVDRCRMEGKDFCFLSWLKRNMYDYSGYDAISSDDMLTCGHKKNIVSKYGNWMAVSENGGIHNEDGNLMYQWGKANMNIKYLDDITAIYNAHGGCIRTMESDKGAKQKYMDYISIKYGK